MRVRLEPMSEFLDERPGAVAIRGSERTKRADLLVRCPGCNGVLSLPLLVAGALAPNRHWRLVAVGDLTIDPGFACRDCGSSHTIRNGYMLRAVK